MLFSSMIFLWLFLPVVFLGYRLIPGKCRNVFLTLASLFFYAWGEPVYICLMLTVILINYCFGIFMDRYPGHKKCHLILCVAINLLILGYFKYYDFFVVNLNRVFGSGYFSLKNIALPIGISFYIFQTLSYVIDLYRGEIHVQKNIIDLALYTSFFPQLIAGPIVKYRDVETQIRTRSLDSEKTAYGIKRFIYGLSKKVILSNTLAQTVDAILGKGVAELSGGAVWLAILLYTLQIYYDFSGYSDMAIGLARMFGFELNENFNYPYIARSVTEFWRRWHISLSTWFKEYVYIPLGGNRKGIRRTYFNLSVVFLLTGFWHGASFNFIVWGALHGAFMIVERMGLSKWIEKNRVSRFFGHVYTLGVVILCWTFFRAGSLGEALSWLRVMFMGNPTGEFVYKISNFTDRRMLFLTAAAILFAGPAQCVFKKMKQALYNERQLYLLECILQLGLLGLCIMLLVNNTYNPFIYFKF